MIADYEPKERMPLMLKGYSIKDHHYDHYDNYDAINVDRAVDIPIDYDGVIGVPITILSYLWEDGLIHCVYTKKATQKSDFYLDNVKKNPIFLSGKQFEIVGMAEDNGHGFSGAANWDGLNSHCVINGKNMFKRIFIKKAS